MPLLAAEKESGACCLRGIFKSRLTELQLTLLEFRVEASHSAAVSLLP